MQDSNFNTVYVDLKCPFCQVAIESGVGFRVGALENRKYRVGDKLDWAGSNCRPLTRPPDGNLKTIGYFNCDNPRCTSWRDCYPEVQVALIAICDDRISEVSAYDGVLSGEKFEIIE